MRTTDELAAPFEADLARHQISGDSCIATSSFQTHSLPLLHLLATRAPDIPVVFMDTGYHFEETLTFRDEVADRLDLSMLIVSGSEAPSDQPLHVVSESTCCARNKIEPLEPLLRANDVWITGVRANQTSVRSAFSTYGTGPHGTVRWHPVLDWTDNEIERYRLEYDLPAHPLDALGYTSIGCAPCTRPVEGDTGRSGRWANSEKTECGLHLATVADR